MAIHIHEILDENCRQCISGKSSLCSMAIPGNEIWSFNGRDYNGCPFDQVTDLTKEMIRAFNFLEKNNSFPNPGTWMDQPAFFIEAVELIQTERAECQIKNSK